MSTNDHGPLPDKATANDVVRGAFAAYEKRQQGRSELTAVEVLQAVEAQEQQKAQEARRAGYAVGHDLESGLREVDNGAEQHTPKPSEQFDKPWVNFTRLLDEARSLELPIPKRKNGTTDTGQLEQDIAARKNGGELPAGEYTASEKQEAMFGQHRIVVEDVKLDPARRLSIGERVRLNRRIQQLRRHAAHKAILELRWSMNALGDPGDSPMVRHNLSVTDRFRALGGPEIMALARKFDGPNFRYVFSDHSVAPEGSVVFQ